MNAFMLLPLQESLGQRGAGTQDLWQGYLTVLVTNYGIIKSLSILTMDIRPMIKFDVAIPWDCFCKEVKWTLSIGYQLATPSALDLDRIHHLLHTLR